MAKSCLITGAAGFIGSHLVDKLLALGHRVIGVDNLLLGRRAHLSAALKSPDFVFQKLDVNDLKAFRKFVKAQTRTESIGKRMVELAHALKIELQKNNLAAFGEIIHENWESKRGLTGGVSNKMIDGWYARARKAGAAGGKLLGAGSGGFLMFYAPPARHEEICRALSNLRRTDLHFEPQGSKIIFVHD